MGELKRAWFTTFNLGIEFFETYLLPGLMGVDQPTNRLDYESLQIELAARDIDVRVFCDMRMLEADQLKRTAIRVHPVLAGHLGQGFGEDSLFHPKVILLEDQAGKIVLGAGSANLTVSGWGRNQEVFDFRTVSNNEQYTQIRQFFAPLINPLELDVSFRSRRKFQGDDVEWGFIHSFQQSTFLAQLTKNLEVDSLTVWSPYLAINLSDLVGRIREQLGGTTQIGLVPDRVGNRFIRTLWSPALRELLDEGLLSFHDYPVPRPDNVDMTHAKVWLASGNKSRLAIGSWNFTGPGSASFEDRNIEAGLLLTVPTKVSIAGKSMDVKEEDFSSMELLKDEELIAPSYPLPFVIQVSFDWEQGCYSFSGQLFGERGGKEYRLRLPGLNKEIVLQWKDRRRDGVFHLDVIDHHVADNEALLANHCYTVEYKRNVEFRGLILETSPAYRRAQGYDSLGDLLDSIVNNDDPQEPGRAALRRSLRHNDNSEADNDSPTDATDQGGLNYFRIFYAFDQFHRRLRKVQSMDELEKWLFVYPGCLQELAAKVREQINSSNHTVFHWFLVQEVNLLSETALAAYEMHRKRYAPRTPPNTGKWDTLRINHRAVSLPRELTANAAYLRQLREECGYVR
jgi:hypothetical protein